jgi:hypothetical protein
MFAPASRSKAADLRLEKSLCGAQLRFAVREAATWIAAVAAPQELAAHGRAREVGFLANLGEAVSEGTCCSFAATTLQKKLAHLSLGQLLLMFLPQ